MLVRAISIILVSHIAHHVVLANPVQVAVLDNTTCSREIFILRDHDSIQIEWYGIQLPSNCKLSFMSSDGYKVCVETWNYEVFDDCDSFKMKYYNGQSSTVPVKMYSCSASGIVPTFCTTVDTHLVISFETTVGPVSQFHFTSSVTLILRAKMTEKDENHMTIVYVVVPTAVVVCISVVGVVMFIVYRKRKQQRNQGMTIQDTTPIIQSLTTDGPEPLDQQYGHGGQAPSAPERSVHSTLDPPPAYSESFPEEPKVAMPPSDTC